MLEGWMQHQFNFLFRVFTVMNSDCFLCIVGASFNNLWLISNFSSFYLWWIIFQYAGIYIGAPKKNGCPQYWYSQCAKYAIFVMLIFHNKFTWNCLILQNKYSYSVSFLCEAFCLLSLNLLPFNPLVSVPRI